MRMTHAEEALSVLVVEDNDDTAQSTASLLSLYGYAARVADCGDEALRLAAIDPPDVVLLDLRMPGMTGWEVAERLRTLDVGKPPLVVAISGCDRDEDRRRSTRAGIDLHLVKPVEPAVLIGLLKRFGRAVGRPRPVVMP